MTRKAQSCELNMTAFRNNTLADAIDKVIRNELASTSYGVRRSLGARHRKLNQLYTALFGEKDMTIFDYYHLDSVLKACSGAEILCVFRLVVYLLEERIIEDDKLSRLLSFKHRFLTSGASYADFAYLMTSEIYDQYICDEEIMHSIYAEKIFFSTCADLTLHDSEIMRITEEWCEHIKVDENYTVSVRSAQLPSFHTLAEKLFGTKGIDELKRADLLCTDKHSMIIAFLEFIDAQHRLAEDIRYLCTFKDLFAGSGNTKYQEMCLADNVFQYVALRNSKQNRICKLDIPSNTLLFEDMLDFVSTSPYRCQTFTVFIGNFYESMGEYATTDTTNLSFDTLMASNQYFRGISDAKDYQQYLFAFYNYCYDKYRVNFFEKDGIDIAILSKRGLLHLINDGYEIVKYNPSDDVPTDDRWIVCYKTEYDASTEHSSTNTITMDFSNIENDLFREWVKEYVWRSNKALKSKRTVANILTEALNYVHAIRMKRILSIFCRETAPVDSPLTTSEIAAIREYYLNQETTDVTKHSKIYNFRAFMQFLEDYDITTVPGGVYYHLYHHNEPNNEAKAIPQDELSLLTSVITRNAEESIKNELYAVIYAIALDTSFRVSKIISLQKDCVHETAKRGEYVIVARDKDATIDETQEPITKETKRMIDRAIDITENLRKQAPPHLKKMLFIVPQNGTVPIRTINRNNFCIYLKKCCEQAGISDYTSANLRDTHMTRAKEYQIKNKLSEVELSVLTGHKTPNVDMEHYVDMDISTMMEALHGIIIGNVDIRGKIVKMVPDIIATKENEVSNGCGYCQSECCKNFTYLDCIMCKDFVTMPSRLPFFEEQIRHMDMAIKRAKTPHDKEDYVNIKRLLVAYESALKTIEVKD